MDESVAYGAKIRATTQPFLLSFHSNAIRVSQSNITALSRATTPTSSPPARPAYARMHAIYPNHGTDNIATELRHCMATLNNANMSGSD
jgi:hypothetical protein